MIQFKGVNHAYKRIDAESKQVLHDINVTIERGEFVAILGHNGSGKSTLAKMTNAILTPVEGEVTVNGLTTSDEENWLKIRQTVGMVFQNPDNQMVATIVEEDVAFACENLGVPQPEMRKRVDEALRIVGMTQYAKHACHKLSGGQKQRIAIAGALAMQPDCLVLDEPTAMLDPVGRIEILETLHKLNRELGMTIVLVTHHMPEAVNASRILVMHEGRIVMDAPPRELFKQVGALQELSLGVPQTVALLHNLNAHGANVLADALTVEETADVLATWLRERAAIGAHSVRPQISASFAEDSGQALCALTNSILEIQDASYVYGADTPFEKCALDGVSFSVGKGEFLGLIGHTGSGKSTLNQLMNGLLKPSSGRVLFNGDDISAKGYKLRELRFEVGLVFQYPEYQLFEQTIEADIAFGPCNQKLSEEEIAVRVREALAAVGLDESLLTESPFALSGGQQRRVAIAGVLAMRPQVLILDEPTAGLDPAGRDEILANIKQYHTTTGATVILVTHGMEEIAETVDRIVVLRGGGVLTSGTPREVFEQFELLHDNGLAPPQVTQVMAKLAQSVDGIDVSVHTVEQAVEMLLSLVRGGRSDA